MIKSLIFDYGGTIDTDGTHWSRILSKAWKSAGVLVDDALFREAYVFGEQELERSHAILPEHDFSNVLEIKIQLELEYLASHGHLPPEDIEPKSAEISQYCLEIAKANIAKALPVLKELSAKYPIVLVSNFYGNLESVLKQFGISGCFKKVIDSQKVGVRKPDPEIFRLALNFLGTEPSETLVIGDSYSNDIEPALKLGCKVLWLKGDGYETETIPETISSEIPTIATLGEVLGFLS